MKGCARKCFYCENPLSSRHEHDHFPIPARHGGTDTVCSCINCHDLKDRQQLGDWMTIPDISDLWAKMTTAQRLFMAKSHALTLEALKQLRGTT